MNDPVDLACKSLHQINNDLSVAAMALELISIRLRQQDERRQNENRAGAASQIETGERSGNRELGERDSTQKQSSEKELTAQLLESCSSAIEAIHRAGKRANQTLHDISAQEPDSGRDGEAG